MGDALFAHDLLGSLSAPGNGQALAVTNPATGEVIGYVSLADRERTDQAASISAAAADDWAATPPRVRGRYLRNLAALLEAHRTELAAVISWDNGKTLTDAQGEISRACEHIEAAAGAAASLMGPGQMNVLPGMDTKVIREPIGPCAVIAPFNFPLMTGAIYWSWALACGNPVIIKPSEQAPLVTTRLGELVLEAGFPPGVVTILHGGREAVEGLCDSPLVSAISLVGSTPTARAVFERASRAGKRAQTAGGARNPLVVLDDASIEDTAEAIVTSAFTMAGQRCLSASVLVVTHAIADALTSAVVERARGLRVGSGDVTATQVPPLISRSAVESAVAAIDAAEAEGGDTLLDGRLHVDVEGGYYFGPTIVDQVAPGGHLVHAELFGPVIGVVRVANLEEALGVVNGSPFGNAASVFTENGGAARTFVARARVGNVGVNVGVVAPTADFAFGGRRGSFFGTVHSQGAHAVEFFTDVKSVLEKWN